MSFVTLKSISYAFTNCSTERKKEEGGGEKTLLIKCLPTEAKLNPNLLNSTNLRSIFIISVAVTDRTTIGPNGTRCIYVLENYQKSLICSEKMREARRGRSWVEAMLQLRSSHILRTVHEDSASLKNLHRPPARPPARHLRAFAHLHSVMAPVDAVELQMQISHAS